MDTPALTVAILAGGAASRLDGRDKGLEPVGGRPLIEWVLDYCAEHVVGIFASPESARDVELTIIANRNLETYARYAPVRTDVVPGYRGPLAGVASALGAATAARVLTLPVDCPMPPRDLWQRLLGEMERTHSRATVACDGERRQPVFALYLRDLAESALAAAKTGQGVWEWQDAIGVVEVDFPDQQQQFHNLNTPEDFAAYADVIRTRD
ncbi:MAG TPA: molybdenum cofactor guanylyltransferase [Rhodanobacteraceae bacterium]|nr:molybdenum cofactor guanylyltransferase [Rhodanobacteraceae bacterium]